MWWKLRNFVQEIKGLSRKKDVLFRPEECIVVGMWWGFDYHKLSLAKSFVFLLKRKIMISLEGEDLIIEGRDEEWDFCGCKSDVDNLILDIKDKYQYFGESYIMEEKEIEGEFKTFSICYYNDGRTPVVEGLDELDSLMEEMGDKFYVVEYSVKKDTPLRSCNDDNPINFWYRVRYRLELVEE
jgi:hypothetical protein